MRQNEDKSIKGALTLDREEVEKDKQLLTYMVPATPLMH